VNGERATGGCLFGRVGEPFGLFEFAAQFIGDTLGFGGWEAETQQIGSEPLNVL
jgi:hypothetical protein